MSKIRILLSFQSAEQRSQIEEGFNAISDIEVVDSAPNGKIATKQCNEYHPDVIIIGKFLGDMDAAEFTSQLLSKQNIGIFIITDIHPDNESAPVIIDALDNGAIDFIDYDWGNNKEKNITAICNKLLPKIRSYSIKKYSQAAQTLSSPNKNSETSLFRKNITQKITLPVHANRYKIVLVGASTGGPEALKNLIPLLKKEFSLPIVIALHMPSEYTGIMAESLNKRSSLNVLEAKSDDILQKGNVYLAPGGYHLLIKKNSKGNYYFKTNQEEPVNGCRPSVDVLFKSAAKIFASDVISVMLTGMGTDGTEGMIELYNKGAYCIAQDKESSVVWGMPGSVVEKDIIHSILPLNLIADKLTRLSHTKE